MVPNFSPKKKRKKEETKRVPKDLWPELVKILPLQTESVHGVVYWPHCCCGRPPPSQCLHTWGIKKNRRAISDQDHTSPYTLHGAYYFKDRTFLFSRFLLKKFDAHTSVLCRVQRSFLQFLRFLIFSFPAHPKILPLKKTTIAGIAGILAGHNLSPTITHSSSSSSMNESVVILSATPEP